MPIYEYKCIGCQSQFELRKGFEENSGISCPVCQSEANRIFSPVPIIFKGSGFSGGGEVRGLPSIFRSSKFFNFPNSSGRDKN